MLERSIEVGSSILLNHQLSDGEASLPKVVKAYLRDNLGSLLTGYESGILLTHVGFGLFKNKEVPMPQDMVEVTSTYAVYEEDGTTLDTDYLIDTDIFTPLTASSGGGSNISVGEEIAVIVEEGNEEYDVIVEEDEE